MTEDEEQKQGFIDKSANLEGKYQAYLEKFGPKHCVHIPREAGDVISLLTEIVYTSQITNLFPRKNEVETPANLNKPTSLSIAKRGFAANTFTANTRNSKIRGASSKSSDLDSSSFSGSNSRTDSSNEGKQNSEKGKQKTNPFSTKEKT